MQLLAQLCLHGMLVIGSTGQLVLLSHGRAQQADLDRQPDLPDGPFLHDVERHSQQIGSSRFLEFRAWLPRRRCLCRGQCRLCPKHAPILLDDHLGKHPLAVRRRMPHRVGQFGHHQRCRQGL